MFSICGFEVNKLGGETNDKSKYDQKYDDRHMAVLSTASSRWTHLASDGNEGLNGTSWHTKQGNAILGSLVGLR